MAKFLLEHCGAEITEHLAKHFPEFVGILVNSVFSPVYAEYENVRRLMIGVRTLMNGVKRLMGGMRRLMNGIGV